MTPARFPHSDTPGSTLGCQLPRAYRRLLRPSSALDAKASTTCPSQLVTHTTNPTHPHHPNTTVQTAGADETSNAHKHNTTRPTPNRAPDASRDNATKKPAHPAQSTRRTNKQTQQNKRQPPTPHPRHKTPRAG